MNNLFLLIFLSILNHFQAIKKRVKKRGFETLRSRGGGYPDLSGSTTKKTFLYVCLPLKMTYHLHFFLTCLQSWEGIFFRKNLAE